MAAPGRTLDVELRGPAGWLADAMEAGKLPPEVLLCSAAGTGKTWAILLLLHLLSLRQGGMRILLARKSRSSLTESVLVTYEQEVLPLTGHGFIADGIKRRVRQSYTYPNGTEWICGGLDDPQKILSTSYDIGYVNEAIELDEGDVETLQSRIGRPDRSHDLNSLIMDTNPGSSSHWLKARCEAGRCVLWNAIHEDNPGLHDGERWTEAGTKYLARLDRLTGTRKSRLRFGLWATGEGAWFDTFGAAHISPDAEYDPRYDVHLAVDSGVHTGAVWFQVKPVGGADRGVSVFGDYYAFDRPAFKVAQDILTRSRELCGGRVDIGCTDPAGEAATATGENAQSEYRRAGLDLNKWPKPSIASGLGLIESFVAVDPPELIVHPRCERLIEAFANYKRAKRGGQWIDRPEDPQHPYEDVMDSLRGGLNDAFPYGRDESGGASWGPSPFRRR